MSSLWEVITRDFVFLIKIADGGRGKCLSYLNKFNLKKHWEIVVQSLIEGREYFWGKAGKALKKSQKNESAKTGKKFGRKAENAMFESGKTGKIGKKSRKTEN